MVSAGGRKLLTPRSNFEIVGTISSNTSYESPWWVLSRSVKSVTLWRHLMTSWRKNGFFMKIKVPQFLSKSFNISCTLVLKTYYLPYEIIKVKVKGQGHFAVNHGGRRNPYFWSNFDVMISKLGGYIGCDIALSWLIFSIDRPLHSRSFWRSFMFYPKVKFSSCSTISSSTSYWSPWSVYSIYINIL